MDQLLAYKIEPYANIGRGNPLYLPNIGGYTQPPTRSPEAKAAWLTWLRALGERYAGRVCYWEMDNEPNFHWPGEPDGVEYAQFVIAASRTLKAIDPQFKVVAPSTADIDIPFIREFLAAGPVPYLDVFCYHAYRTVPEGFRNQLTFYAETGMANIKRRTAQQIEPDMSMLMLRIDKRELLNATFASEYERLKRLLERRGFEGPIWQGETGYPSQADTGGWRGHGPWSEASQAKFVLRRLLTDWFAGAALSSYFLLASKGEPPNRKELIAWENGRFKPAYYALQRLCSVLAEVQRHEQACADLTVLDVGTLPLELTAADVMRHSFTFPSGRKGYVYWAATLLYPDIELGTVNVKLAEPAFCDLQEPVLVDMVKDAVYQVSCEKRDGWMAFESLPMVDYPLVLADRGDVTILEA